MVDYRILKIQALENTGVSKEDIRKLKKDSDDLKKIIAEKEKANEYEKQLRKNGDVTLF